MVLVYSSLVLRSSTRPDSIRFVITCKLLFWSDQEQKPGGDEMCYQTRDYSSVICQFVKPRRTPSTARPPHLSTADTDGTQTSRQPAPPWPIPVKTALLLSTRFEGWRLERAWTAIEADCGGFPDCRNSCPCCGAACGLPPIGAILTSDGANPGLRGAGSVSGSRSPYTFMYCPYYPTAAPPSLPPLPNSPLLGQAIWCNTCENNWK